MAFAPHHSASPKVGRTGARRALTPVAALCCLLLLLPAQLVIAQPTTTDSATADSVTAGNAAPARASARPVPIPQPAPSLTTGAARYTDRFTTYALHDMALAAGAPAGHGAVLVQWTRDGYAHGGRLRLGVNTDTLFLSGEEFTFADGLIVWSGGLRLQALFAGVLPIFHQAGIRRPEYGFWASQAELHARLGVRPAPGHFIDLTVYGRQYLFQRRAGVTDPLLVLPPSTLTLEPRLAWTWWQPGLDPSLWEDHRLWWRVDGYALGVALGANIRNRAREWGYLRVPRDEQPPWLQRNDPDTVALLLSGWARAGRQVHEALRLQTRLEWGFARGVDDLDRWRVGGLNPWVVPLPGAGWPAFLADAYAYLDVSAHVRVAREVEAGLVLATTTLRDPERVGARDWGATPSVTAFLDARLGPWQLDARLGYALPSPWQAERPHVGLLLGAGRAWQRRAASPG